MMKRVLIAFFLFIVAVIAIDRFLLPYYTETGSKTTVPDVMSMTYDQAASKLRWSGLKAMKSYNVRYLPGVPADQVIGQVPEAGSVVKPGRNVWLVLNRLDKPSYPMPDLTGRTEAEACQELERLGLVISEVQSQTVSGSEQDGRVISQSIPPDVTIKSGSPVSFIVGKLEQEPLGLRRVIVPDVLGMSADQARGVIVKSGLVVGKTGYEHSQLLVPDTVIAQKPSANAMVQFGQPVDITVAAGNAEQ